MVAGMMLAVQQQQHFESMLQHSSEMNNSHEVFMWTDSESLIVEVYFSGKRQLSNGYSFAFLGLDLMHINKKQCLQLWILHRMYGIISLSYKCI